MAKRLATIVAGASLVLVAWLTFSLWRSIPPLSGSASLRGLLDSVTVGFDRRGVPHIRASNDGDAMRALGWLHARDRLFAMDIMRRAAEGRLAEVLGGAAVSSDRFLRTLDITGAAHAALSVLPDSTGALLEAYASGVNAWIEHPGRPLPPEFRVLRYRPEPWTVLHSLGVARLMSWDLVTAGAELRLAQLPPVDRAELLPWYPDDGPVIMGSVRAPLVGAPSMGQPQGLPGHDVPDLAAAILSSVSLRSSNSWVISPARSASGRAILANDPHLGLRAPALWYLLSIETPTVRAWGAGIPGLPGVVLGRNTRIAWGLTNLSADDVDYVIERLSADSSRVLTVRGWEPVLVRHDSIRVKGGAAVRFTFRRTSHGPLVQATPPAGQPATTEPGEVRALAMRWNAHDPSDEMSAIWGVMRAGGWTAFLAAVSGWKSPEQNWIYADVDGNIGYTASGNIAVRRSGMGLVPTAGWTDEGRWERYLTFEELPRVLNPPEAFIATANNRVIGREYRHQLATGWELPYRAARIRELLVAGGPFSADDMRRMQLDSVDVFARRMRPVAEAAAHAAGRADIAALLRNWDGSTGVDQTEPAIFYAWYRVFQRLTFDDQLSGYRPSSAFHRFLLTGDGRRWFDDARTPEVEDLATLAARAMREALPLVEGMRWGRIHRTLSAHTLGPARPLEVLLRLNVGPFERSGSPYTVNVAGFGEFDPPFTNTHAASLRHVSDLGDSMSGFIITTGQSGNPLSRRYRDQARLWMRGELWRMGSAIDSSMTVVRLVP